MPIVRALNLCPSPVIVDPQLDRRRTGIQGIFQELLHRASEIHYNLPRAQFPRRCGVYLRNVSQHRLQRNDERDALICGVIYRR